MANVLAQVKSKGGVPIRITKERWIHITENHDYMAGNLDKMIETIENPHYIAVGRQDEKIALKHYEETSISEKYVVAIYKEDEKDGFLITGFMTSDEDRILKRRILWQRQE